MNSFIKRITFLSLIPLLAIGGFFINENPSLIFANVPYHIILYTAEGSYKVDGVDGVDGLDGVQSVAVSPGGNHVYAAAETDDAVTVFTRNSSTGALSFVEMKKDGVGGVDGLNAAQSVTVSPGGNHVYAVGRDDNAVAVFSRNLSTGALTYVEVKKDGAGGVDGLYGAKSVTVSPDGKHLYTAAEGDHAVAVFSINSSTGALTYVEVKKDGAGGVDGIAGAQAVTVSPDGKHVYAASDTDDAIAVFSRNLSTGALTYVEMKKDGVGGVDGLDNAKSVTLSPDGMHLYATSWNDEAISVFSRNSTTGALTYVEMSALMENMFMLLDMVMISLWFSEETHLQEPLPGSALWVMLPKSNQ
jgi:6-phosphogluconolactonase (cycloisomerase 2 family)